MDDPACAVSHSYNIVWLLNCFNRPDLPDGSALRFSNYARQLTALGHRVHLLVPDWGFNQEYLMRLVEQGAIAGFTKLLGYRASGLKNALSRLCIHPGIRNRLLRAHTQPQRNAIRAVVQDQEADVFIFGERMHLFVIPELGEHATVLIDWADSNILYSWRATKRALLDGDLRGMAIGLWSLAARTPEEIYYTRQGDASIFVSPVDKRVLDTLSRVPDRIQILFNGIAMPVIPIHCQKVPDRIIFSGRMDFPPNYDAALWFLDGVLPLIRKKKPGVHCVIAGACPVPALRTRANEHVTITGYIPDLLREIAQSQVYVAPMVSGGGFKNKVVEAIAAGTYVVGTRYAAEALNNELRSCMTVADGTLGLADAVLSALQTPSVLVPRIERAQRILQREFSWEGRTRELIAIVDAAREHRQERGIARTLRMNAYTDAPETSSKRAQVGHSLRAPRG
jgi:glycosyltransferase involved in cell wall biosynthesis